MIKNHRNKNRYLLTKQNIWVRDFTTTSKAIDINNLIDKRDYDLFIRNEITNLSMHLPRIDAEKIYCRNLVIVSDGYDFAKRQKYLQDLPADVKIIGVNRSLVNWHIARKMDYYLLNNPYEDSITYFPSYFPCCVASKRTFPPFLERYKNRGNVYLYSPTCDDRFVCFKDYPRYFVDDYRNPLAAALCLAYHWDVHKILLFCCDDSFAEERSGAIKLDNGLWTYPQHLISQGILEGMCYWLKNQKWKDVKIGNCSSGNLYNNQIALERIRDFFDES